MNEVYLGIGGNLGDRKKNIQETIRLIGEYISPPKKISNFYVSEPWGFKDSKYFLNAALLINTNLSVEEILFKCTKIEKILQRKRFGKGYHSRTADIDILFFNTEIINSPSIIIPHPKLQERLFVLLPLNDLNPNFLHPQLNLKISELLDICTDKTKIRKCNFSLI